MKLVALSAACLCLVLFSQIRARAQKDDLQESKGEFVTYVSGQQVARQYYFFAPEPDGALRAEAEVASASGARQKLVTVATRTKPLSFTAEAGGAQIYSATFGEGTIKVRVAGEPDSDVPSKATVALENLVWHQFHFLFAQYAAPRNIPRYVVDDIAAFIKRH